MPSGNIVLAGKNPAAAYAEGEGFWNNVRNINERRRTPTVWMPIPEAGVLCKAATPTIVVETLSLATKKVRILGFVLTASATTLFSIEDVGKKWFSHQLVKEQTLASPASFLNGYLFEAANTNIKINCTTEATVFGTFWGTEEE